MLTGGFLQARKPQEAPPGQRRLELGARENWMISQWDGRLPQETLEVSSEGSASLAPGGIRRVEFPSPPPPDWAHPAHRKRGTQPRREQPGKYRTIFLQLFGASTTCQCACLIPYRRQDKTYYCIPTYIQTSAGSFITALDPPPSLTLSLLYSLLSEISYLPFPLL